MHLLSPKRPEASAGFFKFAALEMCGLRNACYASSALQMLQKWVPNAPAVLYADKSPAYMQSWTPAKQKDLLQSMPASTAAEVILQLLLQSSHKWWYKALPRPQPRSSTTYVTTHDYVESGLEIDAEDDATTITERPEDGLGDISDEEYDEEEVTWLTSSPVPVHVFNRFSELVIQTQLICPPKHVQLKIEVKVLAFLVCFYQQEWPGLRELLRSPTDPECRS